MLFHLNEKDDGFRGRIFGRLQGKWEIGIAEEEGRFFIIDINTGKTTWTSRELVKKLFEEEKQVIVYL